jgi:hypothetical protein
VYAAGPCTKLVDLRTLAPVIERVFSRYGFAHSPKFLPHLPVCSCFAASNCVI